MTPHSVFASVPPLTASVIVVSRHRPQALTLCLTGLSQQDHAAFEVIVVADPEGLAAVRAQGLAVKMVAFGDPNISAARNAGLAVAAGEVVAFIDDDAVAEPSWLSRLCGGFVEPGVVAATGFVRGRNGISLQWRAIEVDAQAQDHALAVPTNRVTLRAGTHRRAVKTTGTNCAFRRRALCEVGGFDPAFRFYLDEADVNLRMAGLTAVVPQAQVHHAYLASDRRRADRVPTDLTEIAASTAVFLRRHMPGALQAGLTTLRQRETARMLAHVTARRIRQPESDRVLATIDPGWAAGLLRDTTPPSRLPHPGPAAFQPLPATGPRPGHLVAGRRWERRRLMTAARAAVAAGGIATVICLSLTPRAHRAQFHPDGFWLHEGGVFGRSDRSGPRLRFVRFATRVAEETTRWALFRPVDVRKVAQR